MLKINRHPRRHRSCCEFQWPPSNESRPHVNTNTQHFDGNMITKTQVAEIRNFFDNYESNMSQLCEMSFVERRNILSDNMTVSKSAENLKSDKHRSTERGIAEMFYGQYFPKNQSILSSSTPNLSSPNDGSSRLMPLLRPLHKYFYLPEEKIHSNELVKIRQHFDKSYDKHDSSGISNRADEVGDDKIAQTKNQITFYGIKGGNNSSSLYECAQNSPRIDDSNDVVENPLPPPKTFRISSSSLIKNNNPKMLDSAHCGGNESDFTQENMKHDSKHRRCKDRWKSDVKRLKHTVE